MSEISESDFALIRDLIESISGIHISDAKKYLIQDRLNSLLKEHNLNSYTDLNIKVKQGDKELETKLIDVMTTNESLWFRDVHPFEIVKQELLKKWADEFRQGTRNKLKIWCCACSSGQEPYSLAMTIHNDKNINGNLLNSDTVEIVGTDISKEILQVAEKGLYDSFAMSRGLSDDYKTRYFHEEGRSWAINDEIKSYVKFKYGNLQDDFSPLGRFDAVFCRNVIIYFTADFKKQLFKKIARNLTTDGILFLGASETIGLYSSKFERVESKVHKNAAYYRLLS